MGLSAEQSAALCVSEYNLPITSEEFLKEARDEQLKAFVDCPLMPGVRELLKDLRERNIPMAVATSSVKETYNRKIMANREIFESFHVIVNGDDPAVKKGKPAPDIFLVAAERLGASPEECLAFEDSPNGVRAALSAGMAVVWVPDTAHDFTNGHDDILNHPDVQRLGSLSEFSSSIWVAR